MPLSRHLAGLVAVLALAACGGDDAADDLPVTAAVQTTTGASGPATSAPVPPSDAPAPSSAPGTVPVTPPGTAAALATIIEVADDHLAFTLALPDEHPGVASGRDDFAGDGSCVAYWWQLDGGVDIEAWPASCDPANEPPGNGSFGHYRSLADAPDAQPAGEAETVLGPATLGEQIYYECTNSCTEWPLDIAVIELSEPVDHEYPTLTVVTTDRDANTDDLLALLDAFGAG